ncbi:MAG: restriction endonuclease subunit S [bacterium]
MKSNFVEFEDLNATKTGDGIPDGWDTSTLRSLCRRAGTTDPTKNPNLSFEYVDVSSISNELWKITTTTRHTGATAPSRARKFVQVRDVIFATVRPTLKRVALVPNDLDGQIVSTAFCVLRADPAKADSHFLYYSLLTDDFIARMENLQRGASYPAVADSDVLEQEIPVPPLPEQRAIAAVLAKIHAAMEVQDKIVATLKELKAATMAKLFREGLRGEPLKQTEIGEMPESWGVKSIGQVFEFTTKHRGLRFENYESIPFIPMDLIPLDRLFFSDFVLRKPKEITSGTYFEEGDLLVSKITPCFENGKQGIPTKIPGAFGIATTEVVPIKAKEEVSHLPFLAMYLLDSEVRNSLAGKMEGATGRQRLSKSVLEEWPIPFPSFSEQRDIANVLLKIQAMEESNSKKRDILKSLFSSMLHLLMTGRVRVTNLTESRSINQEKKNE